ncbi:MAG: hypothetical protein J1E62_03630 [Lachnospiraceae bacterium]|nr:hypothetical protein [Lachnospiraceae bacterium]
MKRYLILAFAFMMCVGSTGCGVQSGEKQTESKADSVMISEDSTVKSNASKEPLSINVKDSANKISVTETELSEIAASEEDDYVRINNNLAEYFFLHSYKDGYFYAVQKPEIDGPDEVFFYRDSQGQLSECEDFPDGMDYYILYSFDDSIYYYDESYVKRWQNGKETDIIECNVGFTRDVTLTEDYIYYLDVDEDEDASYIGRADYEGEESRQLYALDVCVEDICFYQDAIWFTYSDFGNDDDIWKLGKLDLSSHAVDVYDNLQLADSGGLYGRISINNGFVYFNSPDFQRLNIKDNTVETISKDEVDGLNFVDDSILFFKGKKIYRANNDEIKKIMTVKHCDGIGGINVLDGKIYIKTYAGSMHDEIYQIDLEGNTVDKVYEGEWADELKKKIKKGEKD